jgi:hypothetical protein
MPYDRMAALTYAGAFYDKVCHDARVATKGGYPARINNVLLTPGLPLNQIGAITGEDDCTHFISCCVGQGKGKLQVGARYRFPRWWLGDLISIFRVLVSTVRHTLRGWWGR